MSKEKERFGYLWLTSGSHLAKERNLMLLQICNDEKDLLMEN